MLNTSRVTLNIPAADLGRARAFYADKLGLSPEKELLPGEMLLYRTAGGSEFMIYRTDYSGRAAHTIAAWHVSDVASEVRELKEKGVTFETYDLPGTTWDGEIASLEGMGHAAWFTDSEGNIMSVDDMG